MLMILLMNLKIFSLQMIRTPNLHLPSKWKGSRRPQLSHEDPNKFFYWIYPEKVLAIPPQL